MVAQVDIVNNALQFLGTRTTVTAAELVASTSNEAIQANIGYQPVRDALLRMAPWDCALKTANLTYITSIAGTPENTSAATTLWVPGTPSPPWAYEYQYPVDCLRACWMTPAQQTGFAGAIPITTAVTGGASSLWFGAPVKFKVQIDTFIPVLSATVANGGSGHVVGDIITLPTNAQGSAPIGAPAQLLVTAAPAGVISTVSVVSVMPNTPAASPIGGSYFAAQTNPVAQASSTGVGINATFNLTFGAAAPQRVILTNQEFATLSYVSQILDPNIYDSAFQEAFELALGARLVNALTGDKALANQTIARANERIIQARKDDANEGQTNNDVTPDWIRIRGLWWNDGFSSGPYNAFDWGGLLPSFF